MVKGVWPEALLPVVAKMAGLDKIEAVQEKDPSAATFRVEATEYAVPLKDSINIEEELAKLNADLKHYTGFLAGVEKKLANERFVANAPEAVVALERKKQSDATAKIAAIKASIEALQK